MLQHYVFIRYAKGTTAAHIDGFCRRMLDLRAKIDDIVQLEIGRDVLRETRSWDVLLNMRFQSVEALRRYQQHPEHLAVMAYNQPCVAEVGALDFYDPLT